MYIKISFELFSDSKKRSCAEIKLETWELMGPTKKIILSFKSLE